MKPKFKVGDRVVLIFAEHYEEKWIYKSFKIIQENTVPLCEPLFESDLKQHYFTQDQLELEEIYNSPLYKALQEEE